MTRHDDEPSWLGCWKPDSSRRANAKLVRRRSGCPLNGVVISDEATADLKLRVHSKPGDEGLAGGSDGSRIRPTKSLPTYTVASPGKSTTSLLFVSLAELIFP